MVGCELVLEDPEPSRHRVVGHLPFPQAKEAAEAKRVKNAREVLKKLYAPWLWLWQLNKMPEDERNQCLKTDLKDLKGQFLGLNVARKRMAWRPCRPMRPSLTEVKA